MQPNSTGHKRFESLQIARGSVGVGADMCLITRDPADMIWSRAQRACERERELGRTRALATRRARLDVEYSHRQS